MIIDHGLARVLTRWVDKGCILVDGRHPNGGDPEVLQVRKTALDACKVTPVKVPRTLWVIEGIHAFRDVVLRIAIRKPVRHDEVEVVIRAQRCDTFRRLRNQLKGEARRLASLIGNGKRVHAGGGVFRN